MRMFAALALVVVTAASVSAQEVASYDEFAQLGRSEQVRLFNDISPEARAAIVQTHVERWLAANRERLNAAQIVAVEETLAWLSPGLYDDVDREAEQAELMERIGRLEKVLTREDVARAFGEPGAPGNYIPPPDRK